MSATFTHHRSYSSVDEVSNTWDNSVPLTPLNPALLKNSPNEATIPLRGDPNSTSTGPTAFAVLCRTLRLRLLSLLFSRWDGGRKEEPKVAVTAHRGYAVIRCLVHVLPVGTAIALLVLNASNYYVGGELLGASNEDDQKLAALQFAGKLHELMMLASIAAIVFAYIRRELCFGEGIPFGVLSAGLEIDSLSFLYSPELWSAVWAHWSRKRRQWMLITLLVSCTSLAVLVGPSTNNLMRPRLDDWPAGGTKFWVSAPRSVLYPDVLEYAPRFEHCHHDIGDLACPHGDWRLIESQYIAYWPRLEPMGSMPEVMALNSPASRRAMTVRQRTNWYTLVDGIDTRSIWNNLNTVASTQYTVLADSLAELGRLWSYVAANEGQGQRFVWRRDAKFAAILPQPVAQTMCWESYWSDSTNLTLEKLEFPHLLSYTGCRPWSVDNCLYDDDYSQFTITYNATFLEIVRKLLVEHDRPSLLWVDDSEAKPVDSSISAVAAFPNTNAGVPMVFACTIDLKIAETGLESRRNDIKGVGGAPNGMLQDGTSPSIWHHVQIAPSWANLLNPTINHDLPNMTAFASMAATGGIWGDMLPAKAYDYSFIVESIVNSLVANGAARQTYNDSMIGTLRGMTNPRTEWDGGEWTKYFFPRKGLGFGGPKSIFEDPVLNLDGTTATDETSSMYTMYARVNGWAWASTGKAQRAAMVCIGFYVVLALIHAVLSIIDKKTSSAWDTVPEIVALAAQSQSAPPMKHTGAGIDTVDPLKRMVRVRVVDGQLEYIFDETTFMAGAPVRPNQKYS